MVPRQLAAKRPAGSRRTAIVATWTPDFVSTVAVTRAARVSVTPAEIVCLPRTRTTSERRESLANPSVLLTVNTCVVVDVRARSSVAVTSSRQRPSAGGGGSTTVGSADAGGKATGYVPGCCRSVSVKATAPPGATRVAVTFEGRTTLYESSRCFSAIAVAVRRDDGFRRGRIDPVVHELERVRDRALAAAVGGAVEQLPVEGERGRAAAVEGGAGDGAEPNHRLRELEVRHADAVARPAAVGDDHQHPPVGELAHAGARVARRKLAGGERLLRAKDGTAAADEHRAAADGVRDSRPLGPEDQSQRHSRAHDPPPRPGARPPYPGRRGRRRPAGSACRPRPRPGPQARRGRYSASSAGRGR